ncbi:hypothetical protein [Streptomyces sp. NRRL S-1868]|uniref:hypothetical protein n=1 Tax=Streptomyces sp. NRRL S-1868 TaxID=1463892 RepID=UPI00131BFDB9|nr:hypothetical protein [Streptomyces sp. NRRL S-1868]
MSTATAVARPASSGAPAGRRQRRGRRERLRLVQAGPVPQYGPADPLALSETMRCRLRAALRELLAHPDLDGASDPLRAAVVVLASRTSRRTGQVEMTAGELGRWIGLSADRTSKAVVRPLRRSAIADVVGTTGEAGESDGLRVRLRPLADARGGPLALTRRELAVLWRLVEAVMGPGWRHRDGTVTPAGLLGCRTGRGAGTDRLALLLLVLEANPRGEVPLCGGRVVTQRGRPAATLARLLGCGRAGAEAVLGRLEADGLIERPRRRTGSGLRCRSRLRVPAVAAAHRSLTGQETAARRKGRSASGPDDAPGPVRPAPASGKPQLTPVLGPGETAQSDPDDVPALHALHAPGAGDHGEEEGEWGGFSGEAPSGCGDLPKRARAHEDASADTGRVPEAGRRRSALRAEEPTPSVLPAQRADRRAPLGQVAAGLPRTAAVLEPLLPEPTRHQRRLLERMLGGLLAEGDDDAMIAARLRSRLAKLATGHPEQPYRFRRDALSWAVSIGLPASPGGRTLVPCAVGGCPGRVYGRVTDLRIRCDACELAALSRQEARYARAALETALAAPLPAPRDANDSPAAEDPAPGPPAAPSPGRPAPTPAHRQPVQPVLPEAVREQLDVLDRIDPAAARTARTAASLMYTPDPAQPDGEPVDAAETARRRSWAIATWSTVCARYADQLTAHYPQPTPAGAA